MHTKFVPDYYNFISTNPYTEDLDGLPVINIRNVPLTNTMNKLIKRLIDIIGSIIALILFSPIMLIVAILVKKSSPGPIIFAQERIGLGNKPFKMYKFRSMGVQDPKKEAKEWTTKNDVRVTPVGRVIRKTSLDELPQFWNVLKGDMSLIGPRPERPLFVEKFKEEIPRYMIKHQVRPGITGWAQVNGFRGDTSIRSRIEHDLYYIENWSLGLDIKILFLTFFKGFVNKMHIKQQEKDGVFHPFFLYKLNYLRKSGGIHYDSTAYKTCQTHKAKTKKKISTSDLDHSHSCDRCISRTYAFHSSQKTWENINKKS